MLWKGANGKQASLIQTGSSQKCGHIILGYHEKNILGWHVFEISIITVARKLVLGSI